MLISQDSRLSKEHNLFNLLPEQQAVCIVFLCLFFVHLLGFCEAKMSLAEICENAKMAREYALLGNYDTSLVYYQGVIQQIQKHIQQLKDDAVMKQEWHQVGFFSNYCSTKINSQIF